MDSFDTQLSAANFTSAAQDYVAVVDSVSPLEVLFQGQAVSAVNGGNIPLTVGDSVRVTRFSQQLVIAGNMSAYPTLGVVSAYTTGAANCTVVAGDDTFDAQTEGAYTPAVGDRVVLNWKPNPAGNAYCFCARRGAAVASPPSPPTAPDYMNSVTGPDLPTPPPSPAGPQTALLLAQQTACYYYDGGRVYTGDQGHYWLYSGYKGVEAIDSYWFYGDQVTKVKGATVTKIEMWVQRATGVGPSGAAAFNLNLHNSRMKVANYDQLLPGGDSRAAYMSLKPGQAAWVLLPVGWGQRIADGTAAGVGIFTVYGTDPYMALYGIDYPNDPTKRNSQSGALRITYKRS